MAQVALSEVTLAVPVSGVRKFGPPPPLVSAVATWESVKLVARTRRWAFAGAVCLAVALGTIAIYAPLDIGLVTQWAATHGVDDAHDATQAACGALRARSLNTTLLVDGTAVAWSTLARATCAVGAFPANQRLSVIITAGIVVSFLFFSAVVRLGTLFITDTKTTGRLQSMYGEVKGASQAAGAVVPLCGIDVTITDAWGVGLILAGASALFAAWACVFRAQVLAGLYTALVGSFLFKYAVGNAVAVTLRVQNDLLAFVEATMLDCEKQGAVRNPAALQNAFTASRRDITEHIKPLLKAQAASGVFANFVA